MVVELGLEDRERARRVSTAEGVDEHQTVVAVEQLVCKVHAADAEVPDLHALRKRLAGHAGRDGHTEPVVAEEDVADPGHEHPLGHDAPSRTSTSSGWK